MDMIAIHQIERTVNKVRTVVPPKSSFKAKDKAEFDYLVRVGAARAASGASAVVDPAPNAQDEAPDLSALTKAQLVEFAQANDIEIDPSATKAVIVDAITAAIAGDEGDDEELV